MSEWISSLIKIKSIDKAPNYFVSSDGFIYSKKRTSYLKKLRGGIDTRGYHSLVLVYENDLKKTVRIHREVIKAFKGNSSLPVNHIDGNKINNRLENLEYCTYSHNNKHAYKNRLNVMYSERASKLKEKEVVEIRKELKHKTLKEIAIKYEVAISTISRIKNNKSWRKDNFEEDVGVQ